MIFTEIVMVSIAGAVIALDRVAAFQVMISRPIVAAPIIGALLGDVMTGMKAGLVLELLWIGYLPIGASVPPDETIVAILVSAVTILCKKVLGGGVEEIMALSVAVVVPAAFFAQHLDSYVRKKNTLSAHAADRAADNLDIRGVQRACMRGLRRYFAGYVLTIFIFLAAGTAVVLFAYPFIPDFALKGLRRFYYLLPVVGVASLMSMVKVKDSMGLVLVSFVIFLGALEVVGL